MRKRRLNAKISKKPATMVLILVLLFAVAVLLAGCDSLGSVIEETSVPQNGGGKSQAASGPPLDTTPVVLVPEAPGTDLLGNADVTLDVSNKDRGYITVLYKGSNEKVKLQIYYGGGTNPYNFNLTSGVAEVFPLSQGDGSYKIEVWENLEGTSYSQLTSDIIDVKMEDPLTPFLYPNQYVNFTPQSKAVAAGSEIAQGATDTFGIVKNIYDYIAANITYDYDKAKAAASGQLPGYLPNIDETLETKTGICFDYAALTTAMLRTQQVPTKLVTGYTIDADGNEVSHAWIKVYTEEEGWVDAIHFTGDTFTLMDPTFAASGASADQYIGTGDQYHELNFY